MTKTKRTNEMTTKTAYIISGIVIAIAFTFGCFNAVAPRDTDHILIECGINPVNGAWINEVSR